MQWHELLKLGPAVAVGAYEQTSLIGWGKGNYFIIISVLWLHLPVLMHSIGHVNVWRVETAARDLYIQDRNLQIVPALQRKRRKKQRNMTTHRSRWWWWWSEIRCMQLYIPWHERHHRIASIINLKQAYINIWGYIVECGEEGSTPKDAITQMLFYCRSGEYS